MIMAKKTPIDKLTDDISKIIQEYGDDVRRNLEQISNEIAKKGAQALRNESRQKFGGTGKYARGWKATTTGNAGRGVKWSNVIYNEHPGLPHLLEYGHAKRSGGRVPGRTHIATVEQTLIEEYESEVKSKL